MKSQISEIVRPKEEFSASVLVADDSPFFARLMKDLVECSKVKFERLETAGDGMETIRKIMERKPDILVLDLEMPKMNGLEIASRIREMERTDPGSGYYTYIVLVTGSDRDELEETAFEAGVDDLIRKPITAGEFMMRLRVGDRVASFSKRLFMQKRETETTARVDALTGL